jgi:para-nitrobenzyl esterase
VHLLMALPQAAGLFHRAIAQSGPPTLVPIQSREQAEADGLTFAAELRQPDVQALQALSVQELTRTLAPGPRFGPVMDGRVQRASNVPMIVGQTADENSGLDPDYGSSDPARLAALMQRYFGDRAQQMTAHYLQAATGRVDVAYRAASLDRWLTALWHEADRSRRDSAPQFAYHFEHVEPGPDAERYGAFHTSDVPYALATLDAAPQRPFTDIDRRVSAITSGYWLNFVKSGNPNGPGLPHWPALDPDSPVMLRIGERIEPVAMFSPSTWATLRDAIASSGCPTIFP